MRKVHHTDRMNRLAGTVSAASLATCFLCAVRGPRCRDAVTMPAAMRSRSKEWRKVNLQSASIEPSALVVEGDAGIGKTELWLAASTWRGFRVLSARPAPAESVMAYAALADMLSVIQADAWPDLRPPAAAGAVGASASQGPGPTTDPARGGGGLPFGGRPPRVDNASDPGNR